MSKIGEIRKLIPRRCRSGNPKWINDALKLRMTSERSCASQKTSFGRNWVVMHAIRDKLLPQLAADGAPVRALVIGAGGWPYPEVFEIKNMLMKAGVQHHVSVMDIRREALLGVKDTKDSRFIPGQAGTIRVPPEYYHAFLGRSVEMGGTEPIIEIPEEARRDIGLFHGDIILSQLPPRRFDLITCFNVTDRFSGKVKQLAILNIARGLRSGGFLVTEGVTGLWIRDFPKGYKDVNYEGWKWFTPERLVELGFKMEASPLFGNEYSGCFALKKI